MKIHAAILLLNCYSWHELPWEHSTEKRIWRFSMSMEVPLGYVRTSVILILVLKAQRKWREYIPQLCCTELEDLKLTKINSICISIYQSIYLNQFIHPVSPICSPHPDKQWISMCLFTEILCVVGKTHSGWWCLWKCSLRMWATYVYLSQYYWDYDSICFPTFCPFSWQKLNQNKMVTNLEPFCLHA